MILGSVFLRYKCRVALIEVSLSDCRIGGNGVARARQCCMGAHVWQHFLKRFCDLLIFAVNYKAKRRLRKKPSNQYPENINLNFHVTAAADGSNILFR